MGLLSNKKEEKGYSIEIFKNKHYHLTMPNNPFKEVTNHMKMTVMENGILYQYHDYKEAYNSRFFTGFFVKDGFYYQVTFTDNDLDVSQAEQKMIDYIKLVEGINFI